jgi:hypothetical protein
MRIDRLIALHDGRFLGAPDRFGELVAGTVGGTFAPVLGATEEKTYFDRCCLTSDGYAARSDGRLWIDRGGQGRWIDVPRGGLGSTLDAWRDRVVSADSGGVVVVGAEGEIVADRELHRPIDPGAPVIIGDVLALRVDGGIAVLDEALDTRCVCDVDDVRRVAGSTGELIIVEGEDSVGAWTVQGAPRWQHRCTPTWEVVVVGAWVVVGVRTGAVVLDTSTGEVVGELALPGEPVDVARLGDGLAIRVLGHHSIAWWRPDAPMAWLPHDVGVGSLCALDGHEVASSEGKELAIWRPGNDGPAIAPVATTMPMAKPIVCGAGVVTIEHAGRNVLRGRDARGLAVAVDPQDAWRDVVTRDEALAIVRARIEQRRATKSLAPPAEAATSEGELAVALGITERALASALRAGVFPLEPPRPVPGYDYLGSFTTSPAITVADPIYVGKPGGGPLPLAQKIQAREGTWHAFARNGAGNAADRTAELVAIHDGGFATYAAEVIGSIGVDTGTAGIFDKGFKPPKRDDDAPRFEEGIVLGLGVVTWSGYGDGFYNVFAARSGGAVVKIRIGFLDDAHLDRSYAAPAGGRAYSIKTKFAVGETVMHPKFGAGTVTAVLGDKIEVAFADGTRTLAHAKA